MSSENKPLHKSLNKSIGPYGRELALDDPNLTREEGARIVTELALDKSEMWTLRIAAIEHPHMPLEVLKAIVADTDDDEDVIAAAVAKVEGVR